MRVTALLLGLALPSLAAAGPITLQTSDGVSLKATSYGSGAKGVVLVHDDGASSKEWDAFATKLSSNGFHVVTLDLRGHGANGGPAADGDYALMPNDVAAAATWLTGKGAQEVLVVGAGLGGSVALNAAATTPGITGVAVLTPSLNAHGVKVSAAVPALGTRPVLMVADETDALAAKAATLLAKSKTTGSTEVKLYPTGGAGVRLLNGVPELEGLLVGWLNGSWKPPEQAAGGDRPVQAGSVEDVQTTGTKYEDRGKR